MVTTRKLLLAAALAAAGTGAALLATHAPAAHGPTAHCQTRSPDGEVIDLGDITIEECIQAGAAESRKWKRK